MNEYLKQAQDFCEKWGITITWRYKGKVKGWAVQNEENDKYYWTLQRNGFRVTGEFYQSVYGTQKGEKPNEYDLLSCLCKYNPETFEDFCKKFGYDTDSRKALEIWKEEKRIYKGLCRVFGSDTETEIWKEFIEIE